MLPYAKEKKAKTIRRTLTFGGMDLSAAPPEGTLRYSKNLSSCAYPYISVREDRKQIKTLTNGSYLGYYNALYYVDGTDFYYEDKVRGTVTPGEKQMAVIGKRIVIFPDKLCYNIEEDTMEPLEIRFSYDLPQEKAKLHFTENTITYETDNPDFSFVDMGFRAGDGITIDGFYTGEEEGVSPQDVWFADNNQTIVLRRVEDCVLTFSDRSFSAITPTEKIGKTITISREVPNLAVVTEWNNRLWGAEGNTIYASKPGEPDNFFVYEGISTDGFAAAVGTGGDFTACHVLGSSLLFFKENGVHTIYGTRPQSFRITWKPMPGVAEKAGKSITMLTDGLFYFGTRGPYIYNGATCRFVGDVWGEQRFSDIISASDGRLVYVAMTDEEGNRGLYTWNTQNGIWLREDDAYITALCYDGRRMLLMTKNLLLSAVGGINHVEWEAHLNPLREENIFKKRYGKLWIRVELQRDAYISVKVSLDDEPWVDCGTICEPGTHLLPLHVRPCERLELRFCGEGDFRLREIAREYSEF